MGPPPSLPEPAAEQAYSYLLGLYLGDGYLSVGPRTVALTIACDEAYASIVRRASEAILAVAPHVRVAAKRRRDARCVVIRAYWNRWTELFPQHGPGPKHERPIRLERWQEEIVDRHPWAFLRGLLESDGCRCINRVRTTLPKAGTVVYEYPRWYFVNASEDILQLFTRTCARLGIRATRSKPRTVTVSNRAGVALLDEHVGPKF